jgi:hypothetical protein
MVLFLIPACFLSGGEETTKRGAAKLAFSGGYLVNVGESDLLCVEITNPFYRYIGDIPRGGKAAVPDVRSKFTARYTSKQWIGGYESMEDTFIPGISRTSPDIGLDLKVILRGDILIVTVSSKDEISDIFVEVLQDIPVRISEDKVKYTPSSVGVKGQNLKRGPDARFQLYLLREEEFYKVPIQVTYVHNGSAYDRVFFYSFGRGDFKHGYKTY